MILKYAKFNPTKHIGEIDKVLKLSQPELVQPVINDIGKKIYSTQLFNQF